MITLYITFERGSYKSMNKISMHKMWISANNSQFKLDNSQEKHNFKAELQIMGPLLSNGIALR